MPCRLFFDRRFLLLIGLACMLCGCTSDPETSTEVKVWSRRGLDDGRFYKPRAITCDNADNLYIVDMTGRIQVFDDQQNFVRSWRTPEIRMGKPCGLGMSNDGVLIVADTHYHRVLFFETDGTPLTKRTIGGTQGTGPGEFGYITDVAQDSQNNYYVSEYGEFDRIQKFSPGGKFMRQWGGRGSEDGQFLRPQSMVIDAEDHVWVTDASNHRVQVFDATGDCVVHLQSWGSPGNWPGQLRYPYGIVLHDEYVFICEFGNHRIQRFTHDGQPAGTWGVAGRGPGQLHQPWSMEIDSKNQMHVLDSYNHRVQTIDCDDWHWPLDAEQSKDLYEQEIYE